MPDIVQTSLSKLFALFIIYQEDVESHFSEQIEYDDHTSFILIESTVDFEIDEISIISTVQEINQVHSKPTVCLVKIYVLPSKFHKPISVIGFINTGAQRSMLNPTVLPSSCWENHIEFFKTANGEIFKTSLITKKPIGIQFFPNCIIWTRQISFHRI